MRRSKTASVPECFPLPGARWDGKTIADSVSTPLRGRDLLFMLDTSETVIHITGDPSRPDAFPFNEQSNGGAYVTGCSEFNGQYANAWLWAAVPARIPSALTDLCRFKDVPHRRIIQIDTIEHRLARHYAKTANEPLWLIHPQAGALRILSFNEGLPRGAYMISNEHPYRLGELTRLYEYQPDTPKPVRVRLLSDETDYEWIHVFFREQTNRTDFETVNNTTHATALLSGWVKG
jgi:hypothetical protein